MSSVLACTYVVCYLSFHRNMTHSPTIWAWNYTHSLIPELNYPAPEHPGPLSAFPVVQPIQRHYRRAFSRGLELLCRTGQHICPMQIAPFTLNVFTIHKRYIIGHRQWADNPQAESQLPLSRHKSQAHICRCLPGIVHIVRLRLLRDRYLFKESFMQLYSEPPSV